VRTSVVVSPHSGLASGAHIVWIFIRVSDLCLPPLPCTDCNLARSVHGPQTGLQALHQGVAHDSCACAPAPPQSFGAKTVETAALQTSCRLPVPSIPAGERARLSRH
jgi:hypothetical protein